MDPQIQEIIARVCSTCFNNRRLLAHAVTAGITGLSIVISDELTHDYNIPNTTRHASSSASSSHEIFINHNNVNRPYINNIHVHHTNTLHHIGGNGVVSDDDSSPLVEAAVPVLVAIVNISIRIGIAVIFGSPRMCLQFHFFFGGMFIFGIKAANLYDGVDVFGFVLYILFIVISILFSATRF